jgi:hypothetical protein
MKPINASHDLIKMGLISQEQVTEVKEISSQYSYKIILDGSSITSREPNDMEPIEVSIVIGDIIQEKLKWLDDLYRNEFLKFASDFLSQEICVSNDLKSGININIINGIGGRYEWHIDSNPVTGLLFITDHNEETGGALIYKKK